MSLSDDMMDQERGDEPSPPNPFLAAVVERLEQQVLQAQEAVEEALHERDEARSALEEACRTGLAMGAARAGDECKVNGCARDWSTCEAEGCSRFTTGPLTFDRDEDGMVTVSIADKHRIMTAAVLPAEAAALTRWLGGRP